ncbi:hypothetical protein S40293_10190 [Stachybotrys chartarum IBT 40293]|nr:hypothetical protein S40293_10190 [Stachybotrys chartarum IBT 40293]
MAPEGTKPTSKPIAPKGKEAIRAPDPEPMDTKSDDEEDEEVTLRKAAVQEMKEKMAADAKQTEERMQQLAEYTKANQETLAGEAKELQDRLAKATQRIGEQAEGYNRKIQEMQQLNQRAAAGGKDPGEILRPSAPEPWDGNATALQGFLTQLRTFFNYYPLQFENNAKAMVTYATGCMKGAALQWMEPYLREFNERRDDSSAATMQLFHNYYVFETTLKETFGRIDEEQEIEMKLRSLKQVGSASKVYKAPQRNNRKFQIVLKGLPKNLSTMEQGQMTLAVAYKGYNIPDNEQD